MKKDVKLIILELIGGQMKTTRNVDITREDFRKIDEVLDGVLHGEETQPLPRVEVTLEMFRKSMGRDPWNDDLERCNCPRAGEVGHWDCGWDEVANRPCFAGGARKPRKSREVSFFGQEPAVTGDLDGQELLAGSGPELGLLEPGTTILGSIIGGK